MGFLLRSSVVSGGGGGEPTPLRTRYVRQAANGGSASNDGLTRTTAWTMEHATQGGVLQPGDLIIMVDDGTPYIDAADYGSDIWQRAWDIDTDGTAEHPIIFRSENPRQTVIANRVVSGQKAPAICIRRNHIWFENFTIEGTAKFRGIDDQNEGQPDYIPPVYVTGSRFRYCNLLYGGREGTDGSLNWGFNPQWADSCYVEHCYVSGMGPDPDASQNPNNTGDNTACCDIFESINCHIRYNDFDATGVNSAVGLKAGGCIGNRIYGNIFRNGRSGFGGTAGTGVYMKANTAFDTQPDPCSDNHIYENLAIDFYDFIFFNHGCSDNTVYNNTAYNCDRFTRQFQTNSTNNQYWNNIIDRSSGTTRFYYHEGIGGVETWGNYVSYSNYNVLASLSGSSLAYSDQGWSPVSLTDWRDNTIGATVSGRDVNSVTTEPSLDTAGDYDYTNAALNGAGRYGDNPGWNRTGSIQLGPDWA